MLTLTYAEDGAWRRRHVSGLIQHLRQWTLRRGHKFRCTWVAELTQRGRVHYHLCIWLPRGLTLPKPDKQGWWAHGSTRIEWARKPIAYLSKYASKGMDAGVMVDGEWVELTFPKASRIHGRTGFDCAQRHWIRYAVLPRYVREAFPTRPGEEPDTVRRAYGGGWANSTTGEWIPSWQPPPPGA